MVIIDADHWVAGFVVPQRCLDDIFHPPMGAALLAAIEALREPEVEAISLEERLGKIPWKIIAAPITICLKAI